MVTVSDIFACQKLFFKVSRSLTISLLFHSLLRAWHIGENAIIYRCLRYLEHPEHFLVHSLPLNKLHVAFGQ
jgi:hypothetical protein